MILDLLRLYIKFIVWCFRWGIILWFLAFPCMMVFNSVDPSPEAREALQAEGISGVPLLFGTGSSSYSNFGGTWAKSQQFSYIVVPDSFRRMEIFTYIVTETDSVPVQARVERSRILAVLLVLYIGAGVYTFFVFRRLIRRHREKLAQAG